MEGSDSFKDVTPLVRPRTVAVVGASAKRASQGNVVIQNLVAWGYAGRIHPVHPSADEIDGLPVTRAIEALPSGVDTAIVAVPAADVPAVLQQLERAKVRTAIVFSNGFTAADEAAFRRFGRSTGMVVHGPNCMGLVNFTEGVPLYPSRPSLRLKPGPVAIVAQSGSAAISLMSSMPGGFSKVMTMGSEFQLGAADYLAWLADDEATRAVGVVAESVLDPVSFALAAERLHAVGKPLVVLKVGNSEMGQAATRAHTGALVSSRDAYDDFFDAADIATVRDYDELIASLECAVTARRMSGGRRIAVAGISGGQTALSCDVAALSGIELATFSEATAAAVKAALPGTNGSNPVDIGATVNPEARKTPDALRAMLADPEVGALALLQDAQASLNPRTLENYLGHIANYAAVGRAASKAVVLVSPTGEATHEAITQALADSTVPVLRGLQEGLVAVHNLGRGRPGRAAAWAQRRASPRMPFNAAAGAYREEIAALPGGGGSLPQALCWRILRSYGIPVVRSCVAAELAEALRHAPEIGYPMVVKVASAQVPHRSDVGGVVLDVRDEAALRDAIARIARNVRAAVPQAQIDGFELQEQIRGDAEAVAGFAAAPPFGSLMVVGTGGTLVELIADRAARLAPLDAEECRALVRRTRLGRLLGGYRNLLPETDLGPLATLLARLSELASDLGDVIGACDLNPVLVQKQTGQVRVVDALMVAHATTLANTPANPPAA